MKKRKLLCVCCGSNCDLYEFDDEKGTIACKECLDMRNGLTEEQYEQKKQEELDEED